jgi:hypothetical protein
MLESAVVRDPEIMSGEPTFRGTRVLVRTLFEYLEAGHSLERFLEGFPTVRRKWPCRPLKKPKTFCSPAVEAHPAGRVYRRDFRYQLTNHECQTCRFRGV